MDSSLTSAHKVIAREVEGLQALSNALDEVFVALVEHIFTLKGRVVVSGMGKSGHVARKIAATMASTGTPAMFVHPAEASHGDLGMITKDDLVILLSNSGETAELRDIIHYCKRFAIPLVGLVRRKTSMLVEAANYAFVLPEIPEASPVNAPTTSTTMMLVWGDALAVALLEKRGFSAEDFHIYHPGGKLGSQFMGITQLMRPRAELPVVSATSSMDEVLLVMTQKSLGCALILQDEHPVGIITDGDLRRHMTTGLLTKTAEQVMTPNPITVPHTLLAAEVLNIMNSRNITTICVVDGDAKLTGMVHIHDLLRAGV